jgi:hypothetical protein
MVLSAQPADEKEAIAVVQRTFDGIAAHDGAMLRSMMLPDARIYVVRENGAASSTDVTEMTTSIASQKSAMLERFTSPPRVLIQGRMAQVWGEYEFLRDGKFSHCGVDSASLFKTADGWKIAALTYTVQRTGCRGQ